MKLTGSFHLKQPKVDCVPIDKFQSQHERIFEFETFSILTRTSKLFFPTALSVGYYYSFGLTYNVGKIDYLEHY